METLATGHSRPCEVVVVEDSKTDAWLITQALLQYDRKLRITVLTDGERAASHLGGPSDGDDHPFGPPDLVLLDLQLPRKDGLEVLKELKALPHLSKVPIVVFTSTELPYEIQRCYELGASCVASKPLDLAPFVTTVQSIERYWLDIIGPRRRKGQPWMDLPPPDLDALR
jgi:chemotaxis family two-component system response regulator Rcp1